MQFYPQLVAVVVVVELKHLRLPITQEPLELRGKVMLVATVMAIQKMLAAVVVALVLLVAMHNFPLVMVDQVEMD
jgi:uncharacterized membrane protein YbhN (UPF0104 family)